MSSWAFPIKEAKKIIDASREAKKSEIDRLREQNESIKKDSEAKVSEVQPEHHTDRVKLHLIRAGVALPEDTPENPDASDKALDRVVGLVSVPVGASVEEIKEKDKSPRKVINRLHAKRLWAPGPCAMVHSPEWNAWSRGRGRVAFRHLDPNDDWRPAWL